MKDKKKTLPQLAALVSAARSGAPSAPGIASPRLIATTRTARTTAVAAAPAARIGRWRRLLRPPSSPALSVQVKEQSPTAPRSVRFSSAAANARAAPNFSKGYEVPRRRPTLSNPAEPAPGKGAPAATSDAAPAHAGLGFSSSAESTRSPSRTAAPAAPLPARAADPASSEPAAPRPWQTVPNAERERFVDSPRPPSSPPVRKVEATEAEEWEDAPAVAQVQIELQERLDMQEAELASLRTSTPAARFVRRREARR